MDTTGITPSEQAALDAARLYDMAQRSLVYECASCTGESGETTIEAIIARAAANTHGQAITPELEGVARAVRVRDEAKALLVYRCATCSGRFDEATVEAVIKRSAANAHGEAITPYLEAALAG